MTSDPEHDFLGALDQHWRNYRKQFKTGRREISEASVHDLRVAARRFQALLRILRTLDPHAPVKKLRRLLHKQLDQLTEMHDAQVMVQEADQRIESLPQLGPFRDYLHANSKKLARAARRDIRRSRPSDLTKGVKKIRQVAKQHSDDEKLVERLLQPVDSAHARAAEAFGVLNAEDPATIHRLRIAFKQFRYMIETIQTFLPGYPESYPAKMHDYQEAMGKVRDTTVLLNKLEEFEQGLARGGEAPDFDAKPIELYYQKRLDELIRAYFLRKDEFNSFWRTAPDQPFPWENRHEPVHRTARNRRAAGQPQQRGRGQSAAPNRRRAEKVPTERTETEPDRDPDGPGLDESLPAGG